MNTWPPASVLKPWLLRASAVALLLATFTLYSEPDFVLQLALHVWSCF